MPATLVVPVGGLTPPSAVTFLHRLSPYAHDPDRDAGLWREAGGGSGRPLRVATADDLERLARQVAADIEAALGLDVELIVYRGKPDGAAYLDKFTYVTKV